MNKAHLIQRVAEVMGSRALAEMAVESVFDAMVRELARGGQVSVTGFGTMESIAVSAHRGRNPATGETVLVPATNRVRFRAGKNLRRLVTGAKELPETGSAIRKAPRGSGRVVVSES